MAYAAIRVPRLSIGPLSKVAWEARAVLKVKSSLNQAEQRIKGDDLTETGPKFPSGRDARVFYRRDFGGRGALRAKKRTLLNGAVRSGLLSGMVAIRDGRDGQSVKIQPGRLTPFVLSAGVRAGR